MSASTRIAAVIIVAIIAAALSVRLDAPARAQDVNARDYLVKKGDSLVSIARLYDVTVQAILQANGLGRAQLYPGQRLTIPNAARKAAAGQRNTSRACGDSAYYIVRRGDTLPGIASNSGMNLGQMKRMNGLRTEVIWVGQVLRLPCNSRQQDTQDPSAAQEACGPNYIVQAGEQLVDIADRCGLSPTHLLTANGLVTSTLLAGQYLVIPQAARESGVPTLSSEN